MFYLNRLAPPSTSAPHQPRPPPPRAPVVKRRGYANGEKAREKADEARKEKGERSFG